MSVNYTSLRFVVEIVFSRFLCFLSQPHHLDLEMMILDEEIQRTTFEEMWNSKLKYEANLPFYSKLGKFSPFYLTLLCTVISLPFVC